MERTICDTPQRVNYRNLIPAGVLTAFVSACATAIIYTIASAFGAIPNDVVLTSPTGTGPLSYGGVITAAIIAAAVATALYAFIDKVSSRPVAGFRVAVIVLLVSSLSTPFGVHGAPAGMIAALMSMHIVVAVTCFELLARLARE